MRPIERPLALALIATALVAVASVSRGQASPPPRPTEGGGKEAPLRGGWLVRRLTDPPAAPKIGAGGVSLSLSWDESFAPPRLVTTIENSTDQPLLIDNRGFRGWTLYFAVDGEQVPVPPASVPPPFTPDWLIEVPARSAIVHTRSEPPRPGKQPFDGYVVVCYSPPSDTPATPHLWKIFLSSNALRIGPGDTPPRESGHAAPLEPTTPK